MKKIAIVLFALPCFAAHADNYQTTGPYFYLGAGYDNAGFDAGQVNGQLASAGININSSSTNGDSTAYRLRGGYNFNDTFGVEGGYTRVGQISYSGAGTSGILSGTGQINATMNILDIVGTATTSIYDGVYLTGKLGISRLKIYAQGSDNFTGKFLNQTISGSGAGNGSDSKTGITVGVGLKYYITDTVSARLDVDRYQVPSGDGISAFEVFAAGVQFQF